MKTCCKLCQLPPFFLKELPKLLKTEVDSGSSAQLPVRCLRAAMKNAFLTSVRANWANWEVAGGCSLAYKSHGTWLKHRLACSLKSIPAFSAVLVSEQLFIKMHQSKDSWAQLCVSQQQFSVCKQRDESHNSQLLVSPLKNSTKQTGDPVERWSCTCSIYPGLKGVVRASFTF